MVFYNDRFWLIIYVLWIQKKLGHFWKNNVLFL